MAFFCTKTGVRIAAPGVSKFIDPIDGQDEVVEVDGVEKLVAKPKAEPKKSDDHKSPPADEKHVAPKK